MQGNEGPHPSPSKLGATFPKGEGYSTAPTNFAFPSGEGGFPRQREDG